LIGNLERSRQNEKVLYECSDEDNKPNRHVVCVVCACAVGQVTDPAQTRSSLLQVRFYR